MLRWRKRWILALKSDKIGEKDKELLHGFGSAVVERFVSNFQHHGQAWKLHQIDLRRHTRDLHDFSSPWAIFCHRSKQIFIVCADYYYTTIHQVFGPIYSRSNAIFKSKHEIELRNNSVTICYCRKCKTCWMLNVLLMCLWCSISSSWWCCDAGGSLSSFNRFSFLQIRDWVQEKPFLP